MLIRPSNLTERRGPVELLGNIEELQETAKLFGMKSLTCWLLLAQSALDEKRGKQPMVLLSHNQFLKLIQKSSEAAVEELANSQTDLAHSSHMLHTASIAVENPSEPFRTRAIEAVLEFSTGFRTYDRI